MKQVLDSLAVGILPIITKKVICNNTSEIGRYYRCPITAQIIFTACAITCTALAACGPAVACVMFLPKNKFEVVIA